MALAAPALPVELWLLVFDELSDLTFLWSTCRSVSPFLRACTDDFFRRGVAPSTLVDLHYSDFHTRSGPVHSYLHVPMAFDRFSADGLRAVYQQRAYKDIGGSLADDSHAHGGRNKGSVRGWVPFVERYCKETLQPNPQIVNKTKASKAPPLWEAEHPHWRNTLSGDGKSSYLLNLGNMTSIGRGDRPPFYLKIGNTVNDTDLVDLAIDCDLHEISFDWRKTFALFFRELHFAARAYNGTGKKHVYDADLEAVAWRYSSQHNRYNHSIRARQKRLRAWTAKNKHRMSPEVRLWTERRMDAEKLRVQKYLRHDNLVSLSQDHLEAMNKEIVPSKLASDHPDLLFWPWGNQDQFFGPKRNFQCSPSCCAVL